jgi:hypothetical protein
MSLPSGTKPEFKFITTRFDEVLNRKPVFVQSHLSHAASYRRICRYFLVLVVTADG